jgi:hypothetical protein
MMPYLECMAESAGSFLALSSDSVPEHEHVQTVLEQMQNNLDEGILIHGKLCFLYYKYTYTHTYKYIYIYIYIYIRVFLKFFFFHFFCSHPLNLCICLQK